MTTRRQQRVRRRFEAKLMIERIKSAPCADCGQKFHHCQMDLLHPGDGRPVSTLLLKSKDRIMEDVKRCVLLCANCARLRVWNTRQAERAGDS